MKTYSQLQQLVNQYIDQKIQNADYQPAQLYDPIKYSLKVGGKRLRPVLVLMAYNLFNKNTDYALPAATAVEVFHNFTLLHDDLMDKSDIRRNSPTVHVKWNPNTAILSGDAMQIMAYRILEYYKGTTQSKTFEMFSKTALQVCEGQQYDMNFEDRNDVTVDEYLEMIRLKTAVLIAASLAIGGILAGASESDIKRLYEFGENIGLAFQLQDDYLDVFGDTAVFGKAIGNDIVTNKKTYLLIKALELSSIEQRAKIKEQLTKTDFDKNEKIEIITSIYKQLNIAQISKAKMHDYYSVGLLALQKISVDDEKKEILRSIAQKLMKRDN